MAARPDEPDDAPSTGSHDDEPAPDAHEAQATDDERWAAIIAELRDLDEVDLTAPDERPSSAGPDTPGSYPVAPWVTSEHSAAGDAPALSGRDWDGTDQYDEAEARVDAQEHFVPPDPGPVFGGNRLLTAAWLMVVAAPVFWLVVLVAWPGAPALVLRATFILFGVAVGVLIWRMPHRRGEDHDPHGGAVV